MARALNRKSNKLTDGPFGGPPGDIDPTLWDQIADPAQGGVFVVIDGSGQVVKGFDDFLARVRRQVMAGELQPGDIARTQEAYRFSQTNGRPPLIHEMSTGGSDAWAERQGMFGQSREQRQPGSAKRHDLDGLDAAYDSLTEDEYKQWLAKRQATPNGDAEPTC